MKMFGEITQNQNRDGWLIAFQEEKPVYVTGLDPTKLPLTFGEYAELLEWTGRQLSRDKQENQAAIPEHLDTLLQRLEIEQAQWLEPVTHFGRVFHQVAGTIKRMTRQPMGSTMAAGQPCQPLGFQYRIAEKNKRIQKGRSVAKVRPR